MKKTLTVNLGGTVFHIDEDAYRLLDNYLSNLKHYFRKQEGAQEIVEDIETRICELFLEKINAGQQVITIENVEAVIARMGKPEDFESEGESSEDPSAESAYQSAEQSSSYRVGRRLYRNPDDKILGGVLGGLAAYLGWDATWVRIIALILICFYGVMIPIYLICWLIIPEAHTADEKLAMRGEAINVENIGKTVTDGFEKAANGVNDFMNSDKPRTFFQKLGDGLVTVVGVLMKVFLVIVAIAFCPVLFVLVIVLIAMIIGAIAAAVSGGAFLMQLPFMDWITSVSATAGIGFLGVVMCIAVIAIPLFSLLYAIMSSLFHWSGMNTAVKWVLVILWLVSLGFLVFAFSTSALTLPWWVL